MITFEAIKTNIKISDMYGKFQDFLKTELQSIKDAGLYKSERIIVTPQDAEIKLATGETVLNFCANNYLGLSSNPTVIEGAKKALDSRGYGMSSVRFICGTQDIHKELEAKNKKYKYWTVYYENAVRIILYSLKAYKTSKN